MANETPFSIVGNLTSDPELRYTQSGLAVANFSIASTPRTFNKEANEWQDGTGMFIRCTVWREPAEHVAATLFKGMRVLAFGNLGQRNFETKEGEKRSVIELDVQEIGPALRYAQAVVTRMDSQQGGQQQGQQRQQQGNDEPWAAQGGQAPQQGRQQPQQQRQAPQQAYQRPQGQQGGDVWNQPSGQGGFNDETPF